MYHSAPSFQNLLCVIGVSLMLSGCGSSLEVSRQYCPTEGVLADTERFIGSDAQPWQSHMTGTTLDCAWDGEQRKLVTALSVRGHVVAPKNASVPSKLTLPAFAVILDQNDNQLFRKDFEINIATNNDMQTVAFSKNVGELFLTLAPGDTIAGHSILVGFRLTPEQLRANRAYRNQKLGL